MGWQDNSGDIIIDVALTDEGRKRLARGDGSFKIVKWASADDEIDYDLYDKDHASGSAYYDLALMQTPVLEAFTNNTSSMKSKLISIPRTNLLYLPVLKLNEVFDPATKTFSDSGSGVAGTFLCAVDKDTEDAIGDVFPNGTDGILKGETAQGGSYIRIDQGLDTEEISPEFVIDSDLLETQYILEMDNRLGSVVSVGGKSAAVSFVDDDNISSYFFSLNTDLEYVKENTVREESAGETIDGPRGTILELRLKASIELNSSEYLFDQIGAGDNMTLSGTVSRSFKYIDSTIQITGGTTGYTISVPVRFIKYTG
jgi:hypothetical protein